MASRYIPLRINYVRTGTQRFYRDRRRTILINNMIILHGREKMKTVNATREENCENEGC